LIGGTITTGTVVHYTWVPAASTRYCWYPLPVTGTGDRTITYSSTGCP